ncbi:MULTISPECIES: hypothetical protein [unclassified Bacteroides]|uniref:hypothetical protein n=1 Tax=unclassified Bacteroides TaxID=2646097 RepID=UPI000ACC4074|nr:MULTISPECIES: hypothetical protein [unclassified Bacteroides]
MDSFFYNNYYKYFLWNNGLLEHFFKNGKGEILLHIDRHLLEEIGKTIGIDSEDYAKEFESCVKGFCRWYIKYASATIMCPTTNKCIRCSTNSKKWSCCNCNNCKYKPCIRNREDILAVANHILTRPIEYFDKYVDENGRLRINMSDDKKLLKHRLPYFAIVIYLIYKFDNNKTQQWENVGTDIAAKSREFIPQIFQKIHEFDERFDDTASVYDRSESDRNDYAGRILYHLPLSTSTRNKIQDAIYKSSAWKSIDSMPFLKIIGLIMNSLKDVRANDELRNILLKCYSNNDYKGISARKVQSVIDDFDIEAYEAKIVERTKSTDFSQTVISGEFALGIYFPNDDEQTENSIVLLTTVLHQLHDEGVHIAEGGSGTLAGYNTSFVKLDNVGRIELKDYSLRTNMYKITSLRTDDVIFFYEYDDSLFIQTRKIIPAKSYIVAVRKGTETVFDNWCNESHNLLTKWPIEDTRELFGTDWTIYYTEDRLNGQFYVDRMSSGSETLGSTNVVMKGGIKKNGDTYFINALPYFEVPSTYKPEDVKVYINLNGYSFDNYNLLQKGNRLIIDIPKMPIDSMEVAYLDVCVECNKTQQFNYSISVCGQATSYNTLYAYKFDRFGILTDRDTEVAYYGNNICDAYQTGNIQGLFQIKKSEFSEIIDELYFTNLLAACCFDSVHYDITHTKFRKCVSYAATRLDIDIQKDGFIGNVKRLLSNAGVVQIDYTTSKCQAVPPYFTRVPFSDYYTDGSQLFMLGGCYTRAFIADLMEFCKECNVSIFSVKNTCGKDEERLLPPIILLGHNFSSKDFSQRYGQQYDIMEDYDLALSLLNVVPSYTDVFVRFHFEYNNSYQFLEKLDPASTESLPRIRTMRSTNSRVVRFIEKPNCVFSEIAQGLMPWASIYCHYEKNTSMVFIQRDYSVYLPVTLMLPNYVERALFLMNMGLPETKKVFVCFNPGNSYFSLMNQYKLHNEERCNVFAKKITGAEVSESNMLVRNCIHTKHKMDFYKSNLNGSKYREKYMVLRDINGVDILAVAHNHKVYLNCQGTFFRVDAKNVNEVMTFLIQDRWVFGNGCKAIGYTQGGGQKFETVFNLTTEVLDIPDFSSFSKENIQII